ncbi:MAG: VanZ family protein [Cruoricaptor ignavus]|nr:VanZ family protein [Cruoricaptor ignavus]
MLRKIYKICILPYTIVLLYLMLFGFGREQMEHNVVRLSPLLSTITFVQKNLMWNNWQNIVINLLGNIVMFVPFGFLGWVFSKLNNFKVLIINFLFALVIVESLQYFSRMGVLDIDDFILNTIGVSIGFLLKKKIDGLVLKSMNSTFI